MPMSTLPNLATTIPRCTTILICQLTVGHSGEASCSGVPGADSGETEEALEGMVAQLGSNDSGEWCDEKDSEAGLESRAA